MARKKSGLEESAFKPPFFTPSIGSNAYKIPDEYEMKLLDMYTKLTETDPDIKDYEIPNILENEFNIPKEIIPIDKSFLKSWNIIGTNIVDFEKWLYNGYFWLLLSNHIEDIDMLWQDIWAALDKYKDEKKENLRNSKLFLVDVKKLIEIGKLDASAIGMLQTAGNGKVYINYIDFFILLGRLGLFK